MAEMMMFQPGKAFMDSYNQGKAGNLARIAMTDPSRRQSALADLAGLNPEAARTLQSDFDEKDKADFADWAGTLVNVAPELQPKVYEAGVARFGDKFRRMGIEPPQDYKQALPAIQQWAGVGNKGKYTGAPIIVQTENGPKYARYSDSGIELTQFAPDDRFTMNVDAEGNVRGYNTRRNVLTPTADGSQQQDVQTMPPPAGSGGIVFPEDIPPAAARVSDIMESARREIGQLVANGMPIDQATTIVTQKYARGRGLTMPTQGQAPAASQSAPTAPTAPPRQAPVTPARVAVKPEKTYRIATAQEKAAVGIPADVPAQVGPDGKIDPINVPKPAGPSFSDETTFRKEYAAAVKPYRDVIEQYGRVEAAAKSPTAAGDLSLIFAYMKMLDPGSVVREGEFANAQNAAGLPDRVVNTYNNIVRGERLNPAQRADFLAQARNFKIQSEKQYEALDAQYRQMARDYNIPVDRVVTGTPPSGRKPTSGKELPAVNSRGWRLEVDKNGNRAYVSPDRKQFEEVQ